MQIRAQGRGLCQTCFCLVLGAVYSRREDGQCSESNTNWVSNHIIGQKRGGGRETGWKQTDGAYDAPSFWRIWVTSPGREARVRRRSYRQTSLKLEQLQIQHEDWYVISWIYFYLIRWRRSKPTREFEPKDKPWRDVFCVTTTFSGNIPVRHIFRKSSRYVPWNEFLICCFLPVSFSEALLLHNHTY